MAMLKTLRMGWVVVIFGVQPLERPVESDHPPDQGGQREQHKKKWRGSELPIQPRASERPDHDKNSELEDHCRGPNHALEHPRIKHPKYP